MSRYERTEFNFSDLDKCPSDEARNRLLFEWWCDNGEPARGATPARASDRSLYIAKLAGVPTRFPSRAPLQNDPAPRLTDLTPQGFRKVYLLSKPEHLRTALTDHKKFSNIPYAALGGASFLLGLNPGNGYNGIDWHAEQQALVKQALDYKAPALRVLAQRAVDQAALTSLASPDFDLAQFAEQAALRYMGILFGYGFQDHPLLEEASRATYRALQYLAVGQHFVSEPGTLPAAQQALGRLITRTSQLMEDYTRLKRSKRRYGPEQARDWPDGVQPWSELKLGDLGEPLLKRLPELPANFGVGDKLSGRDRATVAATLLAGTLGNIQSAVCLLVQSLLNGQPDECEAVSCLSDPDTLKKCPAAWGPLEKEVARRLAWLPPIPVLPRRTVGKVELNDGAKIPANTDCLLLMGGQAGCPQTDTATACPSVWGQVSGKTKAKASHACLGQDLALPLIAALVGHTLHLPGLKPALDLLTGDTLQVERLWGFACTRYPLRFERESYRAQQNLIVSMRVKAPVGENAMRLRRLIAAGVPRIEHVLNGFGHVHMAWFEFSDDDSHLVLRTIYDGQFEAYVQHFALQAGDLFDGLFEYLEGASPRPVAEHPYEFVETLRIHNLAPLAGYLFSAYPHAKADQIRSRIG